MSAPHTDPEKQTKQHRFALSGMAATVIFAFVLLLALVGFLALRGQAPTTPPVQVDGRTGASEGATATDQQTSPQP